MFDGGRVCVCESGDDLCVFVPAFHVGRWERGAVYVVGQERRVRGRGLQVVTIRVRIVILYVFFCRPYACDSRETRAERDGGKKGRRKEGFHVYWQGGKEGGKGGRVIVQKNEGLK